MPNGHPSNHMCTVIHRKIMELTPVLLVSQLAHGVSFGSVFGDTVSQSEARPGPELNTC